MALAAGSLGATAQAASTRGPSRPSFSTSPAGLDPGFAWGTRDYAIRCQGNAETVRVRGTRGWRAKVGSSPLRAGGFARRVASRAGHSATVTFRRRGRRSSEAFHVRCLAPDFPAYSFTRSRPGGPAFFFVQLASHYAAIFDRHGVPIWWYKASGEPDNAQLLPDGTLAWDPVDEISFQTGDYQIHTLTGRLLRTVRGHHGNVADIHDIQLLANGHYLIGTRQVTQHVDMAAFGGPRDASVYGVELQEITPGGRVVWRWDSRDHIGLRETTSRWWHQILAAQPYDVIHWNAVEPDGRFLLLSFRHLDAVYEISRRTGHIIWKLGGTRTSKSLRVLGDPKGSNPLGGQHDVRVDPDGTITVHDNRTGLGDPPRAVRYRIDPRARTARLVQTFSDRQVPSSFCCGSARRLASGSWLVGWGGNGLVGGYDSRGRRLFKLVTPGGFSYRANPVPNGALSAPQLRHAMDVQARRRG